jgi:hypothetical protein
VKDFLEVRQKTDGSGLRGAHAGVEKLKKGVGFVPVGLAEVEAEQPRGNIVLPSPAAA